MDENNMTAAGQTAPAAAQTEAPAEAAEQTVTVGALRGAIERRQEQNMRRAGRSAEQRVAEHIRARGLRPAENGLGSGGAGIVVRPDVSRMSRADRAALAARAERGERVKLSL